MTAFPNCSLKEANVFPGEQSDIIHMVNTLNFLELQQYSAFFPKDLRHYAEVQKGWMQDSAYFLGIDLGRRPDPGEIADKILKTDHSQRFRAYYALKFPDRVTIDKDELKRHETAALRMLIDR